MRFSRVRRATLGEFGVPHEAGRNERSHRRPLRQLLEVETRAGPTDPRHVEKTLIIERRRARDGVGEALLGDGAYTCSRVIFGPLSIVISHIPSPSSRSA